MAEVTNFTNIADIKDLDELEQKAMVLDVMKYNEKFADIIAGFNSLVTPSLTLEDNSTSQTIDTTINKMTEYIEEQLKINLCKATEDNLTFEINKANLPNIVTTVEKLQIFITEYNNIKNEIDSQNNLIEIFKNKLELIQDAYV